MKKFFSGIITAFAALLLFSLSDWQQAVMPPDPTNNNWVIAPRYLTLQEGVTKAEARAWMEQEYLPLYRDYRGWNVMLGEPTHSGNSTTVNDNAIEKGDFVMVYFFDTEATKDHYFPPNSNWWEQEDIQDVLSHHQVTFDEFGKYFIQDKYQNEEYRMFARAR